MAVGGMSHLLEQIGQGKQLQGQQPQQQGPIPGKCGLLWVPLANKEYYTDIPSLGPTPFGLAPGGSTYSEIRDANGKVTAIQKHEYLQIIGTGIIAELVDHPSWWEKRDSGGPL